MDAAQQRMKEINPEAVIHKYNTFFLPETAEQFDFTQYDYVADAIDTVAGLIIAGEIIKDLTGSSVKVPE